MTFLPKEGDPKAELDLEFNVLLAPKSYAGAAPISQTTIGLERERATL